MAKLPKTRGALIPNRSLADLTWLRVGGCADYIFQPADLDDLQYFLTELGEGHVVFPLGVGSNLIVRDGGMRAIVIRLGRAFSEIKRESETTRRVRAGAAALDSMVARKAAQWGIDLAFLRTIPGSIGGAVAMNAGCYGRYLADCLQEITLITRQGQIKHLKAEELGLGYRRSNLPHGAVVVEAVLEGPAAAPDMLAAKMAEQLAHRDKTQPIGTRTAGSTFRNPAGFSSTGQPGDPMEEKAWALIDAAGMRGAKLGQAAISEKHSNFLLNLGGATAAELENLGEKVIKKVFQQTGFTLEWEILRVGKPAPEQEEQSEPLLKRSSEAGHDGQRMS